jgi:deoxyribonuclease-4
VISLERLKAIHLNDSMNDFAAHKDRHEKIGKGRIGLEAFAAIINHPKLRDLPFYLETPCDLQGYKEEIALLKSLRVEK